MQKNIEEKTPKDVKSNIKVRCIPLIWWKKLVSVGLLYLRYPNLGSIAYVRGVRWPLTVADIRVVLMSGSVTNQDLCLIGSDFVVRAYVQCQSYVPFVSADHLHAYVRCVTRMSGFCHAYVRLSPRSLRMSRVCPMKMTDISVRGYRSLPQRMCNGKSRKIALSL